MIKNLLKISLVISIVYLTPVFGQSFSFIPAHTHLTGAPETDIAFEIPLINLAQENITICIVRRMNALPGEWTSSFCFDESCFPPFLDSIATTSDFQSSPIAPGATVDFSLHVFPDTTRGLGQIKLVAKNMKNLADSIVVDLTASNELTGIKDIDVANDFKLFQNYPNPFNPSTVINFFIDTEALISLDVFDVLGNHVGNLFSERKNAGMHSITFQTGNLVSGIYFYRITANYDNNNPKSFTKKMILEK